jgi:hypothetical protein
MLLLLECHANDKEIDLAFVFPESFAWILEWTVKNPRGEDFGEHWSSNSRETFKLFVGVCIFAREYSATSQLFNIGINRLYEIRKQHPKVSEYLRQDSCFLCRQMIRRGGDSALVTFAMLCLIFDYVHGNPEILQEFTQAICDSSGNDYALVLSNCFCTYLADFLQRGSVSQVPKFPPLDEFLEDWKSL